MNNIVKVTDLSKVYDGRTILNELDLQIEVGEIFVLLGKNGAGKSTLFKLLTGLAHPTMGKIEILGNSNYLSENLKSIGSNINEPVFYEHLTATENLEIHCQYMSHSTEKIAYWLEYVGLTASNDVPVKKYSMGMRQRLVLARCLSHEPELIIIDEPLNGLDPKGIKQFRELIQKIAQAGKTVIMSSHILSEVEQVATQIAVLYEGNLVLNKTKKELQMEHENNLEDYLIAQMEGE